MKKFKTLRMRMLQQDYTGSEVAARAGMHPSALSTRLTGRAPFTAWEMVSIAKVLEIPPEEYHRYFFDSSPEDKGGRF